MIAASCANEGRRETEDSFIQGHVDCRRVAVEDLIESIQVRRAVVGEVPLLGNSLLTRSNLKVPEDTGREYEIRLGRMQPDRLRRAKVPWR